MSRRVLIRAVSFIVFAFLMLAAITAQNIQKSRAYRQVISDNYSYAFAELLEDVSKLDYALQKSNYATTAPIITSLCAEIFRESSLSTAALSQLPVSELNLENTAKFLSRTGDYAYYISKKVSRGEQISQKERDELKKMSQGASEISRMLHSLSRKIQENPIDIDKTRLNSAEDPGSMRGDIENLEKEFSEYPVLIYDGPFSDHISERNPTLTEGMPEISEDDAKKRAASFLGMQAEAFLSEGIRHEGESEIYSLRCDRDGYSIYADVTKRGGVILRVISSRTADKAKISTENAIERARQLLAKNGFQDMRETYYMLNENNLTINFAAHNKDVVLYPDLVKVTIALDDGSITNFDATGYIINHRKREIRDISGDRKTAQSKVSPALKILSYSPAIIPTDGKGEVLSHEFKCEDEDGRHCIVYVNADTYNEEKILILIEDENGTLTM